MIFRKLSIGSRTKATTKINIFSSWTSWGDYAERPVPSLAINSLCMKTTSNSRKWLTRLILSVLASLRRICWSAGERFLILSIVPESLFPPLNKQPSFSMQNIKKKNWKSSAYRSWPAKISPSKWACLRNRLPKRSSRLGRQAMLRCKIIQLTSKTASTTAIMVSWLPIRKSYSSTKALLILKLSSKLWRSRTPLMMRFLIRTSCATNMMKIRSSSIKSNNQ